MTTATTVVIPSNPTDITKIQEAIKEADACLFRIESEKLQIKSIVEDLVEKFPDISAKYFKRMITVYHKDNYKSISGENEEFELVYESIVK